MNTQTPNEQQPARFALGVTVATPGALAALATTGENAVHFLARHARGDWGDLDTADQRANERALKDGSRLLSAYHLKDTTRIWIWTEADRSSTCLMLPSEY